jgi:hypothetical protein
LHPDFAEIIRASRQIWKDTVLDVMTNGTLIPSASQDVLDALRESHVEVHVSDHACNVLDLSRLQESRIVYAVFPRKLQWRIRYRFDESGKPIPFHSNPRQAWSTCWAKRMFSLSENMMYRCCTMACVAGAVNEGVLSATAWQNALTHQPLSPDADEATMRQFFNSQEIKECCVCPEQSQFTNHVQLC